MLDEMILLQLPDVLIVTDIQGKIIRWNEAATAFLGYSECDAKGHDLNLIIPPNLREAHWRGFHMAVTSGAMSHERAPVLTGMLHQEGQRVFAHLSFGLIKDKHDVVCAVVAVACPEQPRLT
ncbi:PAS domain-containing protein [Escherichia coli]|uniref:PAS domain-containing protein n=1 Tax=Escherichia coli TaxID=562 RepID=UPI000BE5A0B4|nr:PAS domain-containing protein [Escherichia coli]